MPPRVEWSEEDICELSILVQEHGCKWRKITAEYFPTRSEDSLRNQYKRASDPFVSPASRSEASTEGVTRVAFTEEEDEELTRLVFKHDCQWNKVAEGMSFKRAGRKSFRNRWSRYVLDGDTTRMKTILKGSREVEIVLRSLC